MGQVLRTFSPLVKQQLKVTALISLRSFAAASGNLKAVKELREKSGAPITEVKAALEEAQYNIEEAFQVLRKRGLAAATKKASRRAAEGLIGLAAKNGSSGALVEVNSETDFVAKNDQFRSLVSAAAQAALDAESPMQAGPSQPMLDVSSLGRQRLKTGKSLEAAVQEVAGTVRENIRLRRAYRLTAANGIVANYLHLSPAAGLGRIGSLVAVAPKEGSTIPAEHLGRVQDIGNKLAMHAVAARPLYLDRQTVPEAAIEAEKDVLREQAAKSGKPASIIDKMVLGRLNKFYEEVCFLEQIFVMDDSVKVKDLMEKLSKEAGMPLTVTGFVRVQCGEGLEDEDRKDFATEVQETLEKELSAGQ